MSELFQPMSKPGRSTRQQVILRKSFSDGEAQAKYEGPALSAQDLLVLQAVLSVASETPPARETDEAAVPVEVRCSFRRLGEVMGLGSAGAGKTTATIVGCLGRLGEGVFGWSDGLGEPYVEAPLLADVSAMRRDVHDEGAPQRRRRLHVRLHPRLTEGVRAGRTETHHLKLNMHEVRALRSESARLLHHRMSQLNVGGTVPHGLDTLATYLLVHDIRALTKHQRRHFLPRLDQALEELRRVGWTVQRRDELTVTGYAKFDVTRSWAAMPIPQVERPAPAASTRAEPD